MISFIDFAVISLGIVAQSAGDRAIDVVAGAEVFSRACLSCHRSEGPSAFDLSTDAARIRRSATAALAVRDGLMPPWLPATTGSPLRGSRELSAVDERALLAWLDAGAPGPLPTTPGEPPHPGRAPLDGARLEAVTNGWKLGAQPGMAIRTFAVSPKANAPLLVAGLELNCDSPGLIHRVSLLADSAGFARRLDTADPEPGYDAVGDIGLVASGSAGAVSRLAPRWELPHGFAIRIPPESVFVTEVHADARGKVESSTASIDLLPADPESRVLDALSLSGLRPIVVDGNMRAIAILVRTGSNTQSLRVRAVAPDGHETILLDIPRWNERLSEPWVFLDPVEICAGSRLTVESIKNPLAEQRPELSQARTMTNLGEPVVVILAADEVDDKRD